MLETCEDRTVPTAVVTIETLGSAIEGNDAVVRFTRSDTSGTLFVSYSIGGTATPSVDHNKSSTGIISFANGVATADLTITTTDDSESEPTETIIVNIEPDSGYTIGGSGNTTAYIYDNDAQVISLGSADAFEGGANGLFRFHRIGDLSSSLTVNFTVGGTATSGTDYTSIGTSVNIAAWAQYADVVITALPDNLVEDPEYVQATLATGTGYSIGSPNYSLVFIHDDPPVVSVAAGADAFEDGNDGYFVLTRTGGDLTTSLAVSYSVGGTATSSTDYTALSGSVTFEANSDTAIVTVTAADESSYDPGETVTLTVSSTSTYQAGTDNTDTIDIVDVASLGFSLNSYVGTATYDIPWTSVDENEAAQSLTLSNFSLLLAGHTFTPSTATFTTAPTAEFAFGEFIGITFAIDTSMVSSYPFTSVSMSGDANLTVSAIDAGTSGNVTANALAKPEVKITDNVKGLAAGQVDVSFTWGSCDGAKFVKIVEVDAEGKQVAGGAASIVPINKDSGKATETLQTATVNGNIRIAVLILDAKNKIIVQSESMIVATK